MTTLSLPSRSCYKFDGKHFVYHRSVMPFILIATFFLSALYPIESTPTQTYSSNDVPIVLEPPPDMVKPEVVTYIKHTNATLSDLDATNFAGYVIHAAKAFKLDVSLLLALIKVESGFKPESVSTAGAVGLAQVIPRWHTARIIESRKRTDTYSMFEPKLNIYVGAWALRDFLDESGNNTISGLLRYNGSFSDPKKSYALTVVAEATRVRDKFLNSQPKL